MMQILSILINKEDEEQIGFVLNYIASKIKKGHSKGKFPAKWKLEEKKPEGELNTFFILFETDTEKSVKSRIFRGVFDSPGAAFAQAVQNNYICNDKEIDIVPAELNDFKK